MSNTEGFKNPDNKPASDPLLDDHLSPATNHTTSDATADAAADAAYADTPGTALEPVGETAVESAGAVASENSAEHGKRQKKTKEPKPQVKGSLAGGTWVALILGSLLLILLLVFILQNQQAAELNLFAWSFTFPAGVGFLLSAIAGALIMALVGGVRMLELRRQVKKQQKQR